MSKLRQCCSCKEYIPIDEFKNDPKMKDGKRSQCPTCYSIYQKNYWQTYRKKRNKERRERSRLGEEVKPRPVKRIRDKDAWRKARNKKKKLLTKLGGKYLKFIPNLDTTIRKRKICLRCCDAPIVPFDEVENGGNWELFCQPCSHKNNTDVAFREGNIPKQVIDRVNHMIKLVGPNRTLNKEEYIELANKRCCVRCERKSVPTVGIAYYSTNTKEFPGIFCEDCQQFYERWTKVPVWAFRPVQKQCNQCLRYQDPSNIKVNKCDDCRAPKKKKEKTKNIIFDEYGNRYVDYSDPDFIKRKSIERQSDLHWKRMEARDRGELILCLYCDKLCKKEKMYNEDMCVMCKRRSTTIVW